MSETSTDRAGRLSTFAPAAATPHWGGAPVDDDRFAFEQLDVWPRDRVLELDFGNGRLLGWLVERARRGFVGGVDVGALMVQRASRRHRHAIAEGRVQLCCGGVTALPFDPGSFDKAFSVGYQQWDPAEPTLRELHRVLRDGGTLGLALRTTMPGRRALAPTLDAAGVREVEAALWRAGFGDVRQRRRRRGGVTLLLATR